MTKVVDKNTQLEKENEKLHEKDASLEKKNQELTSNFATYLVQDMSKNIQELVDKNIIQDKTTNDLATKLVCT